MKSRDTYHFYLPTGESCHGTIEEAQAAGALPSVTTVLAIIRKEHVEKWKIREGISAALTLKRKENESLKDYANRCITHSERLQAFTTEFGTAMHKAIETFHLQHQAFQAGERKEEPTAESASEEAETIPWMKHYIHWFHKNVDRVLFAETNTVSLLHGFAGQVDAIVLLKNGKIAILDFKTQKVKEKLPWRPQGAPTIPLPPGPPGPNGESTDYWPAGFYETWLLQLCAYRHAIHERGGPLAEVVVSIAINSQEPTPMQEKFWNPQDYETAFQAFLWTLKLWLWTNQFTLPKIP